MKTWKATIIRIWFTETWTEGGGLRKIANAELSTGETICGRPGGRVNTAVHPDIAGKEFEITTSRDGHWFDIDD